ncbi:MAG: peptidoglycan DD-metalloendopeptidase family protein [Anaerovoracaceae bacterium]
MRKVITATLIMTLLLGLFSAPFAFGANTQTQLNNLTEQIKDLQVKLVQGKSQETQLSKKINELQKSINATQNDINKLLGNISSVEGKIAQAYQELEQLEHDMAKQNEALNSRLRTMYKNGTVSYIDVLLGSKGISDMMVNIERVKRIFKADQEVMIYLDVQHKLVNSQRLYLASLQEELKLNVADVETKKNILGRDKNAVAQEKNQVSAENKQLEKEIDALNQEANRLIAEIRKLQGDQAYAGGIMAWPVPGQTRITSEFGYRLHPILKVNKLHTGLDIACPTGTNVVAANFGTVIKAEWNNSYGYMIMVDHGGSIVTLYAHNSSLVAKVGDVVSRGQTIAKSGSTGSSTGPHLHFEVRVNGEYQNPRNWI